MGREGEKDIYLITTAVLCSFYSGTRYISENIHKESQILFEFIHRIICDMLNIVAQFLKD